MAGVEGQTVANGDEKTSTIFNRFEQHKQRWIWLAIATYLFINNTINATSVWMEYSRHGKPTIGLWEPFTWEYSSAISVLILLPLLFLWFARYPLTWQRWRSQVLAHVVVATLFAMAHVAIMVSLREVVYAMAGGNYDFSPVLREFFYEWRKDIWGYCTWLIAYHSYHFIYRRLRGEASFIEQSEEPATTVTTPLEHVLVKKLDKEYLVKLKDVEWLESAGNYVNLHSKGRTYPLRSTMKQFIDTVSEQGFKRVHRSFAVNIDTIAHIAYQSSGDGEITLQSGATLPLSRRYKDEFKQHFSPA